CHVDQRVDPGEPAVDEPHEGAERALHPLVVAALDGQHRGQLADEQRLGHAVDEGRRDEQQQREARPDRSHQAFQAEGTAGDGEVQDRDQRPQTQAAPGEQRPHLTMTAGRSLDLTSALNAGRSVSSTALSRSSCACSRPDSAVNTLTAWSVGGASALPTTLASALMRLLSRIGKLSGSSPLWFLTWYIASSIAPSLVLSESARAAMSRAPACPRACPTTASIWPRTSRIRVTASLAAESRSRIWMRRSNCRCRSAVAYLTRGSSRTVNGC